MNTMQTQIALRQLRQSLRGPAGEQTDHDLLMRFGAGDEYAFTLLVRRHGPMVLGVCRGVLNNLADADDAFQATFLALARQAGRTGLPSCVGGWLHTVARRAAVKLRSSAARRRMHERQASEREQTSSSSQADLREVLDEEVSRLPESCREAILRCYFHGQTREQAAYQLDWSLRTLERRLEQGRELLRERLTARGVTLGVLLALAPIAVPRALADLTVRSALGGAPNKIAELARHAASGVAAFRWKFVLAAALLTGLLTGAGLILPVKTSTPARAAALPGPAQKPPAAAPLHDGEQPLPEHAIARLGTTRFRHGYSPTAIAYSRDGKLLASRSISRPLCLWDATTGRLLRQFKGLHFRNASALAISPDGRAVAVTEDSVVKLWSVETGKGLREYTGHTASVLSIAFSPDGKVLATAGRDTTIRLWDSGTGREMHVLKGHAGTAVNALAFGDGGSLLASAGSDGTVRLWDPLAGTPLHVCKGHRSEVLALAFEPAGKHIVSTGLAGGVRLWNNRTGKQERILAREGGRAIAVAFAPDGRTIAVGRIGAIVLHDVASGKELRRWEAPVAGINSVAWSPDGKTLASCAYADSTIHMWDPNTGKELSMPADGHFSPIDWLMFNKDGSRLFTTSWEGRSLEWDVATRKNRLVASARPASSSVDNFAISSDRKILALTYGLAADPVIDLYDTTTNKKRHTLSGHTDAVMKVAFDADGRRLFSLGRDRTVRAWDVGTGAPLWQANVGAGRRGPFVRALDVSSDGKRVACVIDSILHVLDAATGKELRKYQYGQHVFSLAWSPDGSQIALVGGIPLATGGVDLGVWDVRTGVSRTWKSPQAGSANQIGVAVSADSRFLATGGDGPFSSDLYVWELATGGKVALFEGHHSGVWKLAFSPDNRTLASGGGDSSILLWDLTCHMREGKLPPVTISAARFADLWEKLADPDAAAGHAALWELVAGGRAVLPFLKARLPAAVKLDAPEAAKLIKQLDADEYQTREKAMKEVAKRGLGAEPALLKALADKPALEPRRRVDAIVAAWLRSPDWLRFRRAVAVLEYNGSAEAKQLLRALAAGAEEARPTKEAAAALARLGERR